LAADEDIASSCTQGTGLAVVGFVTLGRHCCGC
jgi:hypothetical protein